MDYLVRLLITDGDEKKGWKVEVGCHGNLCIPHVGSQVAFRVFGKPLLFDVSNVVFYPGADLLPVVILKPVTVPDESVASGLAASISAMCDGERLIYHHMKEILEPL